MDTPKREVSWLERFPDDIWAYFVWYIPGEQLGRIMMTGATFLWRRLTSPNVVKSINLGQDFMVFLSWPRFLNDFPSLEELSIHSCQDAWSQRLGMRYDSVPSGVRSLKLSGAWKQFSDKHSKTTGLQFVERLSKLETLDIGQTLVASSSWMTHSLRLTKLNLGFWAGTLELPSSLLHFASNSISLSSKSFVSKLPTSLESFVVFCSLQGVDLVLPLLPFTRKLYLGHQPENSSDGPGSSQNILEQLPKSLTWFRVPMSTEINFETDPALTSLLPPTLTDLDIYPVFPCSAWPLLPQQLTSLVCRSPESLCTSVSTIIDAYGVHREVKSIPFETLPRSITSLELFDSDVNQIFCGPPIESAQTYFPPQLTHLNISDTQLSPEAAKLLPSSLTSLNIGNLCERVCKHLPTGIQTLVCYRTLMSPNLIGFLPKSLASLHLCLCTENGYWFDCSTGERIDPVSGHPEYSIHVDCASNYFDWKDYSRLPSTLTSFTLPNSDELGNSFLLHQDLPNLLALNLGASKYLTDISVSALSPHLTTLNLGSSSDISGKIFHILPRCLTSLILTSSKSIFDPDIKHLPRTLREVHLNHAAYLTNMCIPDLPPHLGFLSVEQNYLITPHSFPSFPYSLRSSQNPESAKFSEWTIRFGEICQTSAGKAKFKRHR